MSSPWKTSIRTGGTGSTGGATGEAERLGVLERVTAPLHRFVESLGFEYFIIAVILANAVLLGLGTFLAASSRTTATGCTWATGWRWASSWRRRP